MPLSPVDCASLLGVSRETLARLEAYVALLRSWNPRINLVSAGSLGDVWRRHILDSGQLLRHLPTDARVLVDLGSGAGLPGLILAILGVPDVHLVESDRRKVEFLREAARITGVTVTLHAERIERVSPFPADVVTARALAPVPRLLARSRPFLRDASVCLFLKGVDVGDELTAARGEWIMQSQILASLSDDKGHILRLEGLRHAPDRPANRASRP